MNNIKKLINKEIILYVIFGVLTTIVNLIAYYLFSNIININTLLNIKLINATKTPIISLATISFIKSKSTNKNSNTTSDKPEINLQFINFMNSSIITSLFI